MIHILIRALPLALLLLALPALAPAQGLGMGNGRSHPELRWLEVESEHFRVVHPEHLHARAVEAATVGEQVWDALAAQVEVEPEGRFTIVLTDEDQVVNGFALPRRMFLWVDINDFATRFGGYDKWLRLVVAHELQHNMLMEAAQDWTGLWGVLGVPGWFIEGLAEYETEEWGAGRSDLAVRWHILRNQHERLDPHDSGFSMVRYLAEEYGDSVITRALHERNAFGLTDFAAGFEDAAGITVEEFEEEWRRVANAYTWAIYGQKEQVRDIGDHVDPPAQRVSQLRISPGGERWAVYGRTPPWSDPTLYTVENDSTERRRALDHGRIHPSFAFSPDAGRVVYAKYHRGAHGSLLYDLKVARVESGDSEWITSSRRAIHPTWSPDGEWIVFVAAEGGTSRLYRIRPDGTGEERLTDPDTDTQYLWPRFSPDGSRLAYARFATGGEGVNLVVMDWATGEERQLTTARSHDGWPLWAAGGDTIVFTSDRNGDEVHNLYAVPVDGGEEEVRPLTDVNEAIFGFDIDPADGRVLARAVDSVDSTRVRSIAPGRRALVQPTVVDERFTSWRDREPPVPVPEVDYSRPPGLGEPRPYRWWKRMDHFTSFVLPSVPWGGIVGTSFTDAARHTQTLAAVDIGEWDGVFGLRGGYLRHDFARMPLGVPGFLSLAAVYRGRTGYQLYDDRLLFSRQSSYRLKWHQPFNFGESLHANHDLEFVAEFARVELDEPERFEAADLAGSALPVPADDFDENTLSLAWRYGAMRPHEMPAHHPLRGQGLLARFTWADEALGSDTRFRRSELDAARAFGLPLVEGLFGRVRAEYTSGQAAPQDFTGLHSDVPLVPLDYMGGGAPVEDLFETVHGHYLRGHAEDVPGDLVATAHLELRAPLLPALPVEAFGVGLGGLAAVLFYDHGRVWDDRALLVRPHTVGWELRVPVTIGGQLLAVPAWGEGQVWDVEDTGLPFRKEHYLRLAVVKPW